MSAGSLALGVFGRLGADERIHAWEEDCYSVFHSVASLLGHLSAADGSTRGLWGMNDAGGPWLGADPTGRRAQFQVQPESDGSAPLPIEPLTSAAVAAVERFGPLAMHGLEYYLPISLAGPAGTRIADGRGRFACASPDTRTSVLITLDSGDSPAVVERRHDLVYALDEVSPSEEALDAVPIDGDVVDFADPVPWRWWLGDGEPHTVTVSAVTAQWTPLAIGRVVSFVSEACRVIGMTEHVGVRLARDARTG